MIRLLLILLATAAARHTATSTFLHPRPTAPLAPAPCPLATANDYDYSSTTATTAAELKSAILESIRPTKRGLSATPAQRSAIESQIRSLESTCALSEPARDSRMAGGWVVRYTTAPPPSNGQLGPFVGVAKQEIDLVDGGYKNILEVSPNKWLMAILDARWEEWDGTLLVDKGGGAKWREAVVTLEGDDDGGGVAAGDKGVTAAADGSTIEEKPTPWGGALNSLRRPIGAKDTGRGRAGGASSKPDYGATSWKVDFDSITISLFGVPLFSKKFDEGTSRVWKMTFLDDDTRVVRAGRTGKGEDDVVFYMTRENVAEQ